LSGDREVLSIVSRGCLVCLRGRKSAGKLSHRRAQRCERGGRPRPSQVPTSAGHSLGRQSAQHHSRNERAPVIGSDSATSVIGSGITKTLKHHRILAHHIRSWSVARLSRLAVSGTSCRPWPSWPPVSARPSAVWLRLLAEYALFQGRAVRRIWFGGGFAVGLLRLATLVTRFGPSNLHVVGFGRFLRPDYTKLVLCLSPPGGACGVHWHALSICV